MESTRQQSQLPQKRILFCRTPHSEYLIFLRHLLADVVNSAGASTHVSTKGQFITQ